MDDYTATLWVCQCCALSHANGECCADDQHGGDGIEPWALITNHLRVSAGLYFSQHADECPNRLADQWVTECECEHDSFSTRQCDGCGSYLHGERHAHTLHADI